MRTTMNINELVDIRDVQVDSNMPQNERIREFNKQIKDPLHYKCNGIKITAKFANNGTSFEECLRAIVS